MLDHPYWPRLKAHSFADWSPRDGRRSTEEIRITNFEYRVACDFQAGGDFRTPPQWLKEGATDEALRSNLPPDDG